MKAKKVADRGARARRPSRSGPARVRLVLPAARAEQRPDPRRGPGGRAGGRRPASRSWGCWPDDPGPGRDRRSTARPSRSRCEAVTFARDLSAAGGGVPDRRGRRRRRCRRRCVRQLAAYGVRTRAPRSPATAFDGVLRRRAGPPADPGRARGGRLGRRDGRRHRPRQRGDGPRRGPRRAWRWPPTCCRSAAWRRSWSPARWSAARRWRRCGSTERPAVFTVAGHAVEAAPADAPGAGDRRRARRRRSPTPTCVARVVVDRGARARPVRQPEVGPGRRRRRPRRRRRGRLRRRARADRAARRRRSGVSRVVTALGWRPHHEQVGQTGSRISPDLYIPCGISGAIQHWAGCSSAEEDPGDQHRRRGADGDQGDVRRHRRPARGRARRSTRRSGAGRAEPRVDTHSRDLPLSPGGTR